MSTRYSTKRKYGRDSIDLGYEGTNIPEDIVVPSCGLEDVDRAMFNLFNSDLPLIYSLKDGSTKKVPVIFATGERFAINRRKDPLRDKNGALIIPLITMGRSGIEQQAQKSIEMGDIGTIDIIRRLSKDDPLYQRLVNAQGFENTGISSRKQSVDRPGRNAGGRLLEPNLGAGLYETISIPVPKFFTAKYEITLWTQFTQHSNEIITTIINGYHNLRARSYRIETPSGYWFNATFEPEISSDTTFDSMSDEERAIKHSFTVTVPAFTILPTSPGIPNGLRRRVSATQFSFGVVAGDVETGVSGNVEDMRVDSHVLDSVATVDDPVTTSVPSIDSTRQSESAAGATEKRFSSLRPDLTTAIGGTESSSISSRSTTRKLTEDPLTGKQMDVMVKVRSVSSIHGEEVLTTISGPLKSDRDLK